MPTVTFSSESDSASPTLYFFHLSRQCSGEAVEHQVSWPALLAPKCDPWPLSMRSCLFILAPIQTQSWVAEHPPGALCLPSAMHLPALLRTVANVCLLSVLYLHSASTPSQNTHGLHALSLTPFTSCSSCLRLSSGSNHD